MVKPQYPDFSIFCHQPLWTVFLKSGIVLKYHWLSCVGNQTTTTKTYIHHWYPAWWERKNKLWCNGTVVPWLAANSSRNGFTFPLPFPYEGLGKGPLCVIASAFANCFFYSMPALVRWNVVKDVCVGEKPGPDGKMFDLPRWPCFVARTTEDFLCEVNLASHYILDAGTGNIFFMGWYWWPQKLTSLAIPMPVCKACQCCRIWDVGVLLPTATGFVYAAFAYHDINEANHLIYDALFQQRDVNFSMLDGHRGPSSRQRVQPLNWTEDTRRSLAWVDQAGTSNHSRAKEKVTTKSSDVSGIGTSSYLKLKLPNHILSRSLRVGYGVISIVSCLGSRNRSYAFFLFFRQLTTRHWDIDMHVSLVRFWVNCSVYLWS